MKYLSRGLLLALVFVMCVTQALAGAEGSVLAQSMNYAYESGRRIEAALSVKLGDGLTLFLPEQTFDAIQQTLGVTQIRAYWVKGGDDNPVMGFAIDISNAEVLNGTARMTADGMAIDTNLLPGKTVLIPLESVAELVDQQSLPVQMDEQTAALLEGSLETYLGIVAGWAMETDGMFFQTEMETAATDVRGGAVRSDHLLVTAEELKDLFVRLAAEFEEDAELQELLESYLGMYGDYEGSISDAAKAFSEIAQGLVPQGGSLKLDMFTDADGNLVGVNFEMDPLFEGAPQSAFAQYDRLDEDGYLSYGFQGKIWLMDGGQAAAKINYSMEQSHTDSKVSQDMLMQGMYQPTDEDLISQITLTDKRQTVQDEGQERLSDAIEFIMESLTPDGAAQDEGSMPVNVVISTLVVTNEEASDVFNSDITISLQALGIEFATLSLNLTANDYAPPGTSGNTVIDLSKATADEQDALMEELQTGLGVAVMNAMEVLPPELLQLLTGEEA